MAHSISLFYLCVVLEEVRWWCPLCRGTYYESGLLLLRVRANRVDSRWSRDWIQTDIQYASSNLRDILTPDTKHSKHFFSSRKNWGERVKNIDRSSGRIQSQFLSISRFFNKIWSNLAKLKMITLADSLETVITCRSGTLYLLIKFCSIKFLKLCKNYFYVIKFHNLV